MRPPRNEVGPIARTGASDSGFTLVEMLVATAIMVAVTGAVFALMNPAQGTFRREPEAADVQQRLRVGVDTLTKDLIMAGAGSYMGSGAGALYNYFAPVMPYRRGDVDDDPSNGVFYRSDAISVMYVPPTPAQTTVTGTPGNNSQEIDVTAQDNCGTNKHDALCGFSEGMRVLIMDPDTADFDTVTITNVQDEALKLQHSDKLSAGYDSGNAILTQVETHTYYLKADDDTQTYQLMHYDGYETELPVVDNVVKLSFEYFGEPQPPALLPGACLSAGCTGPWTTYGPKPPELGVDAKSGDEYAAGENCVFKVESGAQVSRLDVLDSGVGQVLLDPDTFTDGPWCSSVDSPVRFDADLFRIRRIRVHLRVQAAAASMRGPAGLLFTKGGTASDSKQWVADQEITFDVTPRNMNLGR
jgi:prepilin-type N-terminal cleavage/methylation domain-containing protein